jgi:predicted MFS family arabinose efflux permease
MMCFSIAMAVAFYWLGRSHRWHYRADVFFIAQIVLMLSVLALLRVDVWWEMALCLIVGGLCVGVTYSSDLFYGVSGGAKRGRQMAIHELLLSAGMVVGSLGGGWVTEHITLRAAYPICAALLVASVLIQLTIFAYKRARQPMPTSNDSTVAPP